MNVCIQKQNLDINNVIRILKLIKYNAYGYLKCK